MGCYRDGAAQLRAASHNLARACCSNYLVRCTKNGRTLRYLTCTRFHLGSALCQRAGSKNSGRFADVRTRLHPKLRKEAVHFCGFCATEKRIGNINCAHVRGLLTRALWGLHREASVGNEVVNRGTTKKEGESHWKIVIELPCNLVQLLSIVCGMLLRNETLFYTPGALLQHR